MTFPQVKSVEELLKLDGPAGLASDIDETLSWTIKNWVEEMQKLFGNPENLSPEEMIREYQYVQNVSYWRTPEVDAWVQEKAQSNQAQTNLPLIPEAEIYAPKVHQVIPINCYLTIRPDLVVEGTREWLTKHQFPDAPIFAIPSKIPRKYGNRWKAEILKKSYPLIRGIIDDNQGLIDKLGPDYPGTIFLFGHRSSLNSHKFVVPCSNWEAVYREVRVRYS